MNTATQILGGIAIGICLCYFWVRIVTAPYRNHEPILTHQQDSLLNRIVTLDSLIYSLDENEAQKPIIYGKQGYDRSYFRSRDTLCADRRHTTNRLNVVNSRVNNK